MVNGMSADSNFSSKESNPLIACEKRIVAVEAALRSLAQSGGEAHAAVSRMVLELIDEFRGRQEGECAVMKRAGAVALQCARVMDFMERRLAAACSPGEVAPLSQELAVELERLRSVAYEHLSAALNRESEREQRRFPVVFLN